MVQALYFDIFNYIGVDRIFMLRDLIKLVSNKRETKALTEEPETYDKLELESFTNYIFEKLEQEKISTYLIERIRDSLDLNKVLQTSVEEIGKFIKADRCIIALYNKQSSEFEKKLNINPMRTFLLCCPVVP